MFKAIFDQIEDVVQTIMRRQSQVGEVQQLLDSHVRPIADGAWIGQGQQAFLEEFNTEIVPQLNMLAQVLGGYHMNVIGARERMSEADQEAVRAAHRLAEMIDRILVGL